MNQPDLPLINNLEEERLERLKQWEYALVAFFVTIVLVLSILWTWIIGAIIGIFSIAYFLARPRDFGIAVSLMMSSIASIVVNTQVYVDQ